MSDETTTPPPDPRDRPSDPAGTRPKHEPEDLLPRNREPLLSTDATAAPDETVVDGDAVEEAWDDPRARTVNHAPELLPAHRPAAPAPALDAAAVEIPQEQQARFQFVLGALLALGAAAIVIAALIAFGPDNGRVTADRGPAWSAWRPDGNAKARVAEIADRVGKQYRGADGGQLVVVTGGLLEVAGLPLDVVLREPAEQGGDLEQQTGDGILYRLCGLGEKCAITEGKPSRARHLLLRREALELALYTFHYVDVDQVVVFMPPPKGEEPDEALFFRRGDLEPQIKRPLAQSLAPATPSVRSVTRSPDSSFVNDLTIETLFNFSLTQGNSDSRAFLVLDPLTAKSK